jgi:hypothetical protein
MDAPLRNKLWSAICICVLDLNQYERDRADLDIKFASLRLWVHHFNEPSDTLPSFEYGHFADELRQRFRVMKWYEVYDLIEALLAELPVRLKLSLTRLANSFLEAEMSAYRVVDGRVAEIVSATDIGAIEDAVVATAPLLGAQEHLRRALALLTDRAAPDPRNAIKESILAVEAVCQAITVDSKATLGQAIKRLEEAGVALHPALVKSWSSLYGYTSDANGIRHAMTDVAKLTFADGKYMLVSCSAFILYLLELAAEAGVKVGLPK